MIIFSGGMTVVGSLCLLYGSFFLTSPLLSIMRTLILDSSGTFSSVSWGKEDLGGVLTVVDQIRRDSFVRGRLLYLFVRLTHMIL